VIICASSNYFNRRPTSVSENQLLENSSISEINVAADILEMFLIIASLIGFAWLFSQVLLVTSSF